jgi:hypothetical protein
MQANVPLGEAKPGKLLVFPSFINWSQWCPRNLAHCKEMLNTVSYVMKIFISMN